MVPEPAPAGAAGSRLTRLAKRAVVRRLAGLADGEIELVDGAETHTFGRPMGHHPLRARVEVRDSRFYRRVAFGGSTGAGEAYAAGLWGTDDLTATVRVLARNAPALAAVDGGLARLAAPLERALHAARSNTRRGSARNVAAHYDLGNEFFASFLDPTMMYSCAVFPSWASDLETASTHKLDLVCRKLDLSPTDEVVEIGSGWGGFAVHAARHYGCRVVTATVSRRQYEYTLERVRRAGLAGRVEVLLTDYRDLPARLGRRVDKLASIEMIEAVGHRFLPRYFAVVSDLLAADGMALIQAIVIPDQAYDRTRRGVDFIQRHIFPGGLLPSLARISECVKERTDLRLFDLEDITPHYARTLAAWRRRFQASGAALAALGFDERFQRLWEFYFCYCEGGFLERTIGSLQLLLAKPGAPR